MIFALEELNDKIKKLTQAKQLIEEVLGDRADTKPLDYQILKLQTEYGTKRTQFITKKLDSLHTDKFLQGNTW